MRNNPSGGMPAKPIRGWEAAISHDRPPARRGPTVSAWAPSHVTTDGRTWTVGEYARFLVRDAGYSRAEAAAETRLSPEQVSTACRARGSACGPLYRGTEPFILPALRRLPSAARAA